jgi:aldehyde dehydrogenase (NAD+)/coniferyl-aldehyde dehydrogenase
MKNDLPEVAALHALLRDQRHAHLRAPYPSWETRAAHLKALRKVLLDNRDALADAISADFGNRAKQEVLLAEFLLVKEQIDARCGTANGG